MVVSKGQFFSITPPATGVVMTLGNFDGLHRGHQHLISELIDYANGEKTMALTFDPHPSHVVGQSPTELLYTEVDKVAQFEQTGINYLVIQDFSLAFAHLSAEDFLRQFLFSVFSPKKILLGHDFNFGHKGEGNFTLAKKLGDQCGIDVRQASAFKADGDTVSSTFIRSLLKQGDVKRAQLMMGRPFHIQGEVKQGLAIGRTIGFPTANIAVKAFVPGLGVYGGAATVAGKKYQAVLNIGYRPTIDGKNLSVECHLLDFDGDLYGQELKFYFINKIRDEKKFSDIIELKEQIKKDITVAKEMFKGSALFAK